MVLLLSKAEGSAPAGGPLPPCSLLEMVGVLSKAGGSSPVGGRPLALIGRLHRTQRGTLHDPMGLYRTRQGKTELNKA